MRFAVHGSQFSVHSLAAVPLVYTAIVIGVEGRRKPRTENGERRTANREPLLPVRYPDILHLGGVPEEFFALALFGGEPVARFTVGDPGRFQVAG
jgi:hypothetical protein